MAERAVEVVAVGAGTLRVRLLGSACDDCGGCGGRCALFGGDASRELPLPRPAFAVAPGQRLRLVIDDSGLRDAAWRGYGRAWLGLLLGAAAGAAAGIALLPTHVDVLTLAGLVSGTFVAVAVSNRHLSAPQLHPVADAIPSPTPTESESR